MNRLPFSVSKVLILFFVVSGLGLSTALLSAEDVEQDLDNALASKAVSILKQRCGNCHGPEKQEGDLRLDLEEHFRASSAAAHLISETDHAQSLLLQVIRYEKLGSEMPPKNKLPQDEIEILERWTALGAPWPKAESRAGTKEDIPAWIPANSPIVPLFSGKRLDLWSLKPITSPPPPDLPRQVEPRNGIDLFIAEKLLAAELSFSDQLDDRRLIRRLTFDLVGLPATQPEVDDFVADNRPDKIERLVDRLLASPRFGEHQARSWLDVVRYSDSNGFDWDEFRPQAYRYRDYVIASLNDDKSFEQFAREQLAGDELVPNLINTSEDQNAILATGYLRMGPQDNAAGLFNEQDRARAEWMFDLVETTGSAFLGLTMSCCRCHDHKYDPLSQADHYRLRAFFENLEYGDDLAINLQDDKAEIEHHNANLDEQITQHEKSIAELTEPIRVRISAEKKQRLSEEDRELLSRSLESLSEEEKRLRSKAEKEVEVDDKDIETHLDDPTKTSIAAIRDEIKALQQSRKKLSYALIATEKDRSVDSTRILYQGDHKSPREEVSPGFVSVLFPGELQPLATDNLRGSGRRLQLADWIVSPDNPFTARVLANRIWLSHFGTGIVATPNDFGLAGAKPSHPELLDFLASDLRETGWSLKRLHRQIVTSKTYLQDSTLSSKNNSHQKGLEIDSGNQLYWRQNMRRLSAEQLRDNLLASSGLLLNFVGGPPVWPELPDDVLQANPAFLDDNETKTKGWYPSPASMQNVRSIYLVQKRTVRIPFLETFDLPENSASCPIRSQSTVAPQALSLLNNSLAIQVAKGLADSVRNSSSSPSADIDLLFSLTLQRKPSAFERERCLDFLKSHSVDELARAMINLNEFIWID